MVTGSAEDWEEVDPFDLPEWLGTERVIWRPEGPIASSSTLGGELTNERGNIRLACDLIAVDEAFPQPAADERLRVLAHQAWRHDQILLRRRHDRLTLCMPGTTFSADLVLDCLDRLARAVGAAPSRYAALMRVGDRR